jgi:hypothetical protein
MLDSIRLGMLAPTDIVVASAVDFGGRAIETLVTGRLVVWFVGLVLRGVPWAMRPPMVD